MTLSGHISTQSDSIRGSVSPSIRSSIRVWNWKKSLSRCVYDIYYGTGFRLSPGPISRQPFQLNERNKCYNKTTRHFRIKRPFPHRRGSSAPLTVMAARAVRAVRAVMEEGVLLVVVVPSAPIPSLIHPETTQTPETTFLRQHGALIPTLIHPETTQTPETTFLRQHSAPIATDTHPHEA